MIAQVYSPDITVINENLLSKTSFASGLGNYGKIDTTFKHDGYNSMTDWGEGASFFTYEIDFDPLGKDTFTISFFVFSEEYDATSLTINFTNVAGTKFQPFDIVAPTSNSWQRVVKTFNLNNFPNEDRGDLGILHIDAYFTNTGKKIWISQPKCEYGTTATTWCPAVSDDEYFDYDRYGASFKSRHICDFSKVVSYEYNKKKLDTGTFRIEVPSTLEYLPQIGLNDFIFVDNKDFLIVKKITKSYPNTTLEGVDLKGLLEQRRTEVAVDDGTGYDVISGSTETCIRHYILNNCINPTDANKKMPLLTLDKYNNHYGIQNDSYISRFEVLADVVKKLCENADIYFDIYADTFNNKFIFNVCEMSDKTDTVCLNDRHDIDGYTITESIDQYKNTFYATKSGGTLTADAVTVTCTPESEMPSGFNRFETQVNVSCENASEIQTYAKFEFPSHPKVQEYDISVTNAKGYERLYKIGDKISLMIADQMYSAVVEEATKQSENGFMKVALKLGKCEIKPIKRIENTINNRGL